MDFYTYVPMLYGIFLETGQWSCGSCSKTCGVESEFVYVNSEALQYLPVTYIVLEKLNATIIAVLVSLLCNV